LGTCKSSTDDDRNSEYRVILYAKGALDGAPAPADELPIEDILEVKHDVIPLHEIFLG
jgi:hypothetical protein